VLIDYLKTTKGYIGTHHAPQVEDNTKAYSFVQWQAYEDHKNVLDSPTYHVDVIEKVLPVVFPSNPPPLKIVHVQFDKDPTKAFDAPVTEIVVLTLKPEYKDKKEQLKGLLTSFIAVADNVSLSAVWGQTREDEDLFVEIFGWESIEAHMEARKSATPETRKVITTILEFAAHTMNHSKLVKYT